MSLGRRWRWNVTNEEEEATTGIEMSSLQPQVSTSITVAYVDGVGNPFVGVAGVANDAIVDPDMDDTNTDTTIDAGDVKVAVVQVVQPDRGL